MTVLAIVLSQIYVLRNQLIHGGATWQGSVNRDQLRDCTHFMAKLVPLVIEIMMGHPETLWGNTAGQDRRRRTVQCGRTDAGCASSTAEPSGERFCRSGRLRRRYSGVRPSPASIGRRSSRWQGLLPEAVLGPGLEAFRFAN